MKDPIIRFIYDSSLQFSGNPGFLGSNRSIITKIDTIVFIIGLLAALPIAAKSRKPLLAYFFLNLSLFLIFNYHLKETASLGADEHLDYFLDNLVVMTFVFLASFNIFIIRQNALTHLFDIEN